MLLLGLGMVVVVGGGGDLDATVSRSRALRREGRHGEALELLEAASPPLDMGARAGARLWASLLYERAETLVCLNRIDEAMATYAATAEKVQEAGEGAGGARLLDAAMLQTAKLFHWRAAEGDASFARDADGIIASVFPGHPRQWPAGDYVESLRAQPWHTIGEWRVAKPRWAVGAPSFLPLPPGCR